MEEPIIFICIRDFMHFMIYSKQGLTIRKNAAYNEQGQKVAEILIFKQ